MNTHARPSTVLDPSQVQNFILAGNAEFTLVSKHTGNHLSFKVRYSNGNGYFPPAHLVMCVSGEPVYLGIIRNGRFSSTAKSPAGSDKRLSAFSWFFDHPDSTQVEVWHAGSCGRCGRKLTDTTSIALGIGPDCREAMGL